MKYEDNPFDEITLRSYGNISGLSGRELIKKILISLGLLQPHDKRDIIIDVFHTLYLSKKEKVWLSSKEVNNKVIANRKELNLSINGTAPSNIRRILKQLIDYGLVEKQKARYRVKEFQTLDVVFDQIVEKRFNHIITRITSYMKSLE